MSRTPQYQGAADSMVSADARRDTGFYRIQARSRIWVVAYYNNHKQMWRQVGDEIWYSTNHFLKVGERVSLP